ncbi:hypothetical protein J6590_096502 [Homalodisca vitripennis]|nr:hypothetical protein J6590_096502 [Homalodisca vitripennis]
MLEFESDIPDEKTATKTRRFPRLGGNIAIELHIFLPVNLVYALSSEISAFGEDPTVNVVRIV